MINTALFNFLLKGLDNTCKVLFVGDKNQLAPIKEELSLIYNNEYPTSLLNKSVRNSEKQALMDLCEQAKQTVITGKFSEIKEVPGVIDFVTGPQLKGLLERTYNKEDSSKRILCYTNKRVIQYNEYIRELRGYIRPYEIGEILSNNESSQLKLKSRLYTDQLIKVTDIISDKNCNDIITGHNIRIIELVVEDLITKEQYEVTCFADNDDRRDVLKYYADSKRWDSYFKIKNSYPDLRPIAASTTHKAQGSTYESVIVDLNDISTCTDVKQTARMQYVALSRAKKRIFIRGKLSERYFK